ncbi:DeoR/GlpR family DNA-binding transcription regulator [Roseibium aggregatum]|uniref:DeoR/GlpR transcriptional regulator n=1 Tax=Roseibium aggregatum TaxID=187304 RepID=A0A939EIM6_9HYPH|nr:DeoR/GlpR family DNA-binding transcription regulator [Roseibium aggregatum]MBN9673891.1 DeoR/GlpR transcriptional regulator [Roseibium aggregatum]
MEPYANHTQRQILNELRKAGGLQKVSVLAEVLDISGETVRRNVKRLVDMGAVEKSHGSVQLVDEHEQEEGNLQERLSLNESAKKRIAAYVATMIPNESSLFLDIGSTTAYIADALRSHRKLMIVTNSVYVAYRLSMRNDNRVFMAGGELRGEDGGVFGVDAMAFVANFNTDFAILSTAGVDAQNGFTLFDLEEAIFSRHIMEKSGTRIMACDSSKFEREGPVTIGDPALVDHLVTDAMPTENLKTALQNWGVEFHLTDQPRTPLSSF